MSRREDVELIEGDVLMRRTPHPTVGPRGAGPTAVRWPTVPHRRGSLPNLRRALRVGVILRRRTAVTNHDRGADSRLSADHVHAHRQIRAPGRQLGHHGL
jgi:hypothetical protein